MDKHEISRRTLLQGGAALAGPVALGFPIEALEIMAADGEVVVPWLDQPPPFRAPPEVTGVGTTLVWEEVDALLTWNEKFFTVQHYGPLVIHEPGWRLAIDGLVQQPLALTLAELRKRPRQEVIFTLECAGNHGFPFFTGGIGTAYWAGTPLAPLLRQAGPLPGGTEVVFWGADAGPGKVGDQSVTEQFARTMSLADALDPNILLCYEMNGAPLHPAHGFPVRLLAPGWYGVANVKWLTRVEVLDRHCHVNSGLDNYGSSVQNMAGESELFLAIMLSAELQ